jgi:hypothetical protein
MSRDKITTRGPLEGICNICGEFGKLTEDHIPPKGSIRVTQVEMFDIISMLSMDKPKKGRVSQNGVKYRTICFQCNNDRLGLNYDPEFNEFNKFVGMLLKSSLELPEIINVKGKPNKIVRALIGHLLAFELDGYNKGEKIIQLQEYFLNEKLEFPKDINIYYWPYPYKNQIIIKDAGLCFDFFQDFTNFMLLKFFPMAYMVTLTDPKSNQINLPNLVKRLSLGLDDKVDIPIHLKKIPHQSWPEAPTDSGAVLYGTRAMGAIPRYPKHKSRQ